MTHSSRKDNESRYDGQLLSRHVLSDTTVELELEMPAALAFKPGQCIRLRHHGIERDYSIVSAPREETLIICVRLVPGGALTEFLRWAEIGTRLEFTAPHGNFIFRSSHRRAVWIATGTGIAPFVSMGRAGARDFILLHGVRRIEDLYYEGFFRQTAREYVPCLSRPVDSTGVSFGGRVTRYVESTLPPGEYDFYLCGNREMVRDVTFLVDDRFPGSRVFAEIFY